MKEEEGASMVDCCLLLILLSSSSCMWCLLCLLCTVYCFCVGNKVEFRLIVSGTWYSTACTQVTWYKCRLPSFMPSKMLIAKYNAKLPSFKPSTLPMPSKMPICAQECREIEGNRQILVLPGRTRIFPNAHYLRACNKNKR